MDFIDYVYFDKANYPNELPEVIPSRSVKLPGLKEHLQSVLGELLGSSFLYMMVDSTRQWLEDHSLDIVRVCEQNEDRASKDSNNVGVEKHVQEDRAEREKPETKATPKKAQVCRFFKQNKCKFGSKCHNLHPGFQTQTLPTQNDLARLSDSASACASQASIPSKEETETASQEGKKAPLRQAADVISRILWDPDLNTEDFSIGYLDRFVGIIEKPFKAFNWEDLASVGVNVLAVPKHRIQYFKYRDEIIWDKRSQLDNVFGSRGGKVITDIVPASKPSESDEIESGKTDTSDTTKPTPDVEIRLIEDDTTAGKVVYNDRDRPTHFVCIKIHNAQVLANVDVILKHIRSCAPDMASGCLSLEALHVTLCMLRIESESQAQAAQEVLRNLQRSFVQILPPSTEIEFTGVGNFHGRLLYAKVADNRGLSKAVSLLMEQLQTAGVRTPGNFSEYTPHMTLLKLSRPMQREAHTATIVPALYSKFTDMAIGRQKIDTLHLCSTSGPKVDGFYQTLMTLPCSLVCLPPSFKSIVAERICTLADREEITSAVKDSLLKGLDYNEVKSVSFDHTIKEVEKLNSKKNSSITNSSHVVVLRGVPGSGKSYLAHQCAEYHKDPTQVTICSADKFLTSESTGEYSFSTSQVHKAHLRCFDYFLEAILEQKRLIVVDNTNSQIWEYQAYVYICDLLSVPYTILEVPCLDTQMLEMYRSRCIHNLNRAASLSMYERWQKDARATIVPPCVSYPTLRKAEKEQSFSLLSLCSPSGDLMESSEPVVAWYTAVFINKESQWALLNHFSPTHPELLADHVTLSFAPSLNSLLHTKIGKRVKVKVVSVVDDKNIQAAVVVLPRGLSSRNQYPHITLSKESHAFAKDSNQLLESRKYVPMKDREIILEGVIGVSVRNGEHEGADSCVILSNVDYHKTLPRMSFSASTAEQDTQLPDHISICTGTQKVTQLFVFDFDLTLFDSADPKDGREIYERATGKVWPHRGWLGQPESLMPPLSVLPGPALADYRDHEGRAGSMTVVVTARIERTRKAVEKVLEEVQVYPDAVYFKADSSSATETSPQYKARVIKKLIAENKDVTSVKFWDDKADNLTAVKDLASEFPNVRIETINASKIVPNKHESALYSDLVLCGSHLSSQYNSAATLGIEFLTTQYCKMIGYQGNPRDVCLVFGSFPIGRRSDIDMCCLLQSPASPFDCIERFAKQLEDCGLTYIHKGMSSRCPRLKVKLFFDCAPPVAYDIIFAVVENDLTSPNQLVDLSSLKPVDQRSKIALTGPNYLKQVIEAIDGKMSVGEFGMVVEMTVKILRAFRQKGNAYHCIRTFHIVRLLMEYVRSPKFSQLKESNSDEIFKNFIASASEIFPAKWQKLFGDFVPKQYIPRIIDVFASATDKLRAPPPEKPLSSDVFYSDINSRPSFPPVAYSTVSLSLCGSDKPSLWKLASLCEARLQTCTRKLLDAGIDVVPDGNDSYEKFSFAVPQVNSTSNAFKSIFKQLTDELEVHEQKSIAFIEVHIC